MSAPSTQVVEVKVPVAGESITEGVLGRWLAEDGAVVRKGQPLFELETDKTNTEVPSPETGRLERLAKEGETVAVHAVVARISPDGTPVTEVAPPPKAPAPAPPPSPPPAVPAPNGRAHQAPAPDVLTTPLARALMAEHGLTTAQVRGTGAHGRIRREDVLAAISRPAPAPQPAAPATAHHASGKPVRRERMTPVRHRFVERLVKSMHTAAVLTTFNEVDMSAVQALISRHGEAFAKRHGASLRHEAFFIAAAAAALREMPRANSMIEGDEVVSFDYCDISFAIESPSGEAHPILRSAGAVPFADIAKWMADAARRAGEGRLTLSELAGATFGILNDGAHGALIGTPPLHAPQTAALGLHAVRNRVVCDEKRQPAVRPMMYVALAYDHRLLDGKDAVEFLVRIKDLVEAPERLLLGC